MIGFVAVVQGGVISLSEPITQYSSIPASTVITHQAAPTVEVRSLPLADTIVSAPAVEYVRSAPLAHSYGLVRSIPSPTYYAAPYSGAAYYSAPIAHPIVHEAPVVEVRAAPAVSTIIPGEAKYTAVNRGAVHEAPLPGHALSQTSLNLAPAV